MSIGNLLTREEAAKALRISQSQLDYLARSKRITHVKLGDGTRSRVLYRLEDINVFLASCLVPAVNDERA